MPKHFLLFPDIEYEILASNNLYPRSTIVLYPRSTIVLIDDIIVTVKC